MPASADIIGTIGQRFKALSRNMIVGISGRGGAGKSTLAAELRTALETAGHAVAVFHIDDFVFPIDIRDANQDCGKARYFDSYDFDSLMNKLLRPLKITPHFDADVPVLNRQVEKQELRRITVDGPAIIIVEGVQLLRRHYADVFDYKIWIDISFEEGLRRVLSRQNHLGVPLTPEQKTDQYVRWSTAGYLLYEQNDQPREQADAVITHI